MRRQSPPHAMLTGGCPYADCLRTDRRLHLVLWRPRANRRKKEGRGLLRGHAVAASLTLAHTLCGFYARIVQRKIADPPLPSIVLPCRAREVMRSFLSSPDSRGILVGACCDRDKGM